MTHGATEKELLALEKSFWQTIKDGDAAHSAQLSDDTCVLTGAKGVGRIDRAGLQKMFARPEYRLTSFELSSPVVELLTDDVAVVAYKVHEEVVVDGKPLALDAFNSSTWVRRGGRWVCAAHTESVAGDPFGRDRRQTA